MPEVGGSYFTFSNENNDLIWGFLAECHRRGWLYKGHDTMPWCPRCGTGLSPDGDERGLPGPRGPRADGPLPARRPARRVAAGLDHHALDADLQRRGGGRAGPALRPGPPGRRPFWLGKGTLKTALVGPFEVEEEVAGSELVGWRYSGPFDELPAVRAAFDAGGLRAPGRALDEVGEDEGTGIVHIAPGCGAEDFQLGKALGLPVVGPIDEAGHYVEGFDWLTGLEAPNVAEQIVDDLERRGFFYHLEPYTHRYPHCWRCGTPLLFRLVDEWFISHGPIYDQPRETLTQEQVDASLRYQIMEVVDRIRWIPDFGYERELDWLRNMHDWMISKKRYWGLALPIYDCAACGTVEVIGGRDELHERAVEGWERVRGPHAAPAVRRRGQDRLPGRAARRSSASRTSAIRGWTPGSCRSRRSTTARTPSTGRSGSRPTSSPRASRASSATGSTRCSRCPPCSRREAPFKTIFGYALVFGEDGRPMHKSWGNAIEFDEAAERMGVDVMRWMFAKARPEENILFGWHAADEARRELLVLWNVYSFFVTYARLAGWTPGRGIAEPPAPSGRPSIAGSCRGPPGPRRSSRTACATSTRSAPRARCPTFIDDLSTWYLRLSRRRFSRSDDPRRPATPPSRRCTRRSVATCPDARPDPAVPGRDDVREPRRRGRCRSARTAST